VTAAGSRRVQQTDHAAPAHRRGHRRRRSTAAAPVATLWAARLAAAVRAAPLAVVSVVIASLAVIVVAGVLGAGARTDALVICFLPLAILFAIPTEAMVALARIALWGRGPGSDLGQLRWASSRVRGWLLSFVVVSSVLTIPLADRVVRWVTPGLVERHEAVVAVRLSAAVTGLAAALALFLISRRPRPVARRRRTAGIRILRPLLPVARFSLIGGLQIWLLCYLGSWQPTGSIAVLGFCLLVAAGGVSLITAASARRLLLSLDESRGFPVREQAARQSLTSGLEFAATFAFPTTGLLIAIAEPLVGVVLQHGAFSRADAALAVPVLRWLSLGVVSWSMCWLLAAPLFAVDAAPPAGVRLPARLRRVPVAAVPARAAGIGLLVAACLDVWTLPHLGVRGLALGSAVGSAVLVIVLALRARERGIGAHLRAVTITSGRCAAAAFVALAAAWLVLKISHGWLPDLPRLVAVSAAYGAVYLAVGVLFGVPDMATEGGRRGTGRELSKRGSTE
jgi:peptidoglycan biosynthesis protein MviN/MurJ (putative lipid II flippase)